MSYLSQIFWKYFWDVCILILNNFIFIVCLSVCSLPYFNTEIRLSVISPVLDELSFSKFLDIFLGCLYINPNNFKFLFCMSVCSLPHLLTKIMFISYISCSRWATFLKFSGAFQGCFYIYTKQFQASYMSVSLFITSLLSLK